MTNLSNDWMPWSGFDTVSTVEECDGEPDPYIGHFGVTVFFHTREDAEAFAERMHRRAYDPTTTSTDDLRRREAEAHASDCATHNAPAYEAGPCDCNPS